MTATNIFFNFVGFRYSPALRSYSPQSAAYRKWGYGGKLCLLKKNWGGGGSGVHVPMAYNKLRGSVDLFPTEIFEILAI